MKHLWNLATAEIIVVEDKDAQPLIDTLKYVITSKSRYKAFLKEQAKRKDKTERGAIKLKNKERVRMERIIKDSVDPDLSYGEQVNKEAELLSSPEEVEKLKETVEKLK